MSVGFRHFSIFGHGDGVQAQTRFASATFARRRGVCARTATRFTVLLITISSLSCAAPKSVAPPSGPTDGNVRSPAAETPLPTTPPGSTSLNSVPTVPLQSLWSSPAAQSEGFYYQARIGDTLESVARRYGMKPAELRKTNGLDPGTLPHPGQLLFIPGG